MDSYALTKTDRPQCVFTGWILKHGHCLAYTVRALGYPSRETLRHWLDELRPDLRRIQSGTRPTREYAFSEKQHAVVALNTRAGAAQELAKKVGVSRQTSYNWPSRLFGEKRPDDMSKNKNASSRSQRDTLCAELAALEQRVQKLRLEHDILNKANELLKKTRASITYASAKSHSASQKLLTEISLKGLLFGLLR